MEKEISAFITYLHNVKNTSGNTEMSYKRDLEKVLHFMASRGITEVRDVKAQDLSDYVKFLEENKFAAATVSRNIASLKAFYHYMMQEGLVEEDFADKLKAPKIEKKAPEIMTPDEVVRLLDQPSGDSPKEIRDKAMLELLYATGIRVTELITLTLTDVNMQMNFILCRDRNKERIIPFGAAAKTAMERYLNGTREEMLENKKSDVLFANCSGLTHEQTGILETDQALCQKGGHSGGYHAAHLTAFLCGSFGGEWGRFEERAGNARPFRYFHNTDLRKSESQSYQGGVRKGASPRIGQGTTFIRHGTVSMETPRAFFARISRVRT